MLIIDELEMEIEKKKDELAGLKKGKSNSCGSCSKAFF